MLYLSQRKTLLPRMSYDFARKPPRLVYWYPGSQHLPICKIESTIPESDLEYPGFDSNEASSSQALEFEKQRYTHLRHSRLVNYTREGRQQVHYFELSTPVSPTISDCSSVQDHTRASSEVLFGHPHTILRSCEPKSSFLATPLFPQLQIMVYRPHLALLACVSSLEDSFNLYCFASHPSSGLLRAKIFLCRKVHIFGPPLPSSLNRLFCNSQNAVSWISQPVSPIQCQNNFHLQGDLTWAPVSAAGKGGTEASSSRQYVSLTCFLHTPPTIILIDYVCLHCLAHFILARPVHSHSSKKIS